MNRDPHARQRFAFGALEALGNIFGAITASVLTVGLFLPVLNAISGTAMLERAALLGVARLVLALAASTAVAAMVLRGLGRMLEGESRCEGGQ